MPSYARSSAREWARRRFPNSSLQVDAQVRFSWIMLGRKPRPTGELLGVIRDERPKTSLAAVDTHAYTDVAMAIAKLLVWICVRD